MASLYIIVLLSYYFVIYYFISEDTGTIELLICY